METSAGKVEPWMGSDEVKVNRAGVEPPVSDLDLLTQDAGRKSGVSGLCNLFMAAHSPTLGKAWQPSSQKENLQTFVMWLCHNVRWLDVTANSDSAFISGGHNAPSLMLWRVSLPVHLWPWCSTLMLFKRPSAEEVGGSGWWMEGWCWWRMGGRGGVEHEHLLTQPVKRGATASPLGLAAGLYQRDGDLMRAVSNFLGGGSWCSYNTNQCPRQGSKTVRAGSRDFVPLRSLDFDSSPRRRKKKTPQTNCIARLYHYIDLYWKKTQLFPGILFSCCAQWLYTMWRWMTSGVSNVKPPGGWLQNSPPAL